MTTIWWVRHGPTHAKVFVGWTDLPADLSDTEALHRLSAHLPGNVPVVSSDLSRAVATANALQGGRTRLPDDPSLREMHFGHWELRRYEEIEAEDPVRARAFWTRPGDVRPPGGESWNELAVRVSLAVRRLAATHPGGDVIAVAHFGPILSQVQRVRGTPASDAFAQPIDALSVTRISNDSGRWRLHEVNLRP